MYSPLLQSSEKCFEFRSLFHSNLSYNEDINLLENNDEENSFLFPITNGVIGQNESYNEQSAFCNNHSEHKNNSNPINEEMQDKNIETYSQFNSINENCMNLSSISLLTI